MTDEPRNPLADEAEARAEWRGQEAPPQPRGDGHSLPASEDEDERISGGGGAGGPSHTAIVPPPD